MEKINYLTSSYYLWKSFKELSLSKPKKKPESKQPRKGKFKITSQDLEYDAEGQRVDSGRLRKDSQHPESFGLSNW